MLKVIRSGKDTSKFKNEFNAIKHGNYKEFIDLIGGYTPTMVIYSDGKEFDFMNLIMAGPSIEMFYESIKKEFGVIIGDRISNDTYNKIATFELAIRMHANNNDLLDRNKQETLEYAIDRLSDFKNLTTDDKKLLHNGRKFINDIKHSSVFNKNKCKDFIDAYEILKKNKVVIYMFIQELIKCVPISMFYLEYRLVTYNPF